MHYSDDITDYNRIQIVNWRRHGSEESYCSVGAYAAHDAADLEDELRRREIDADYDWNQDTDAEEREDWEHVYYVNDDFTLRDGQLIEHNGRKFRVSVAEVK